MRRTIGTAGNRPLDRPLGRRMAGLVAVLAFLAAGPGPAGAQEPYLVRVTQVDDLKAVFATVESVDLTLARSRIGGTIRDLRIDEGSQVQEGELIARVRDEKLALEAAAVDSRIRAAKSEVKLAKIGLKRMTKLRESNTASQASLDDAQTNLDVANGNLAALQAERAVVAQREAEGDVLAPATGRVLEKPVTDGQVVLLGDVIAKIAAKGYILRLHLPERHARFLEVGDAVRVGARGLAVRGGALREGRVIKVYPELQGGRVVADVDVPGLGDYFVGERTRVFVATGKRNAIVVPRSYVFTRYGVTYVSLADAGETVVQVGLPVDDGIEVLSGLRPGDRLVPPGAEATARADGAGG